MQTVPSKSFPHSGRRGARGGNVTTPLVSRCVYVTFKETMAPLYRALVGVRHQQQLSQKALAVKLRLGQARVAELEIQRAHSLRLTTYALWAKALGVEFGVYYVVDGHFQTINLTADDLDQLRSTSAVDLPPESPTVPMV